MGLGGPFIGGPGMHAQKIWLGLALGLWASISMITNTDEMAFFANGEKDLGGNHASADLMFIWLALADTTL